MSCPMFFFIFVFIVFVPFLPLTTAAIFLFSLSITEPATDRKYSSEIGNHNFCSRLLLFLNQVFKRRQYCQVSSFIKTAKFPIHTRKNLWIKLSSIFPNTEMSLKLFPNLNSLLSDTFPRALFIVKT